MTTTARRVVVHAMSQPRQPAGRYLWVVRVDGRVVFSSTIKSEAEKRAEQERVS